jgi:hypothetical protein
MKQRSAAKKKPAKANLTTLFVKMSRGSGADYADWNLEPLDGLFELLNKAMTDAVNEVVDVALQDPAWINFADAEDEGSTDPLMMEIQLSGFSMSDGDIAPSWHFSLEQAIEGLLDYEECAQILRVRDALAGLITKIDAELATKTAVGSRA